MWYLHPVCVTVRASNSDSFIQFKSGQLRKKKHKMLLLFKLFPSLCFSLGCPANTNYTNKHERITNNYSFVFVRLYSRTRRINSLVCSSFLSSNKHEQTSNYNML